MNPIIPVLQYLIDQEVGQNALGTQSDHRRSIGT